MGKRELEALLGTTGDEMPKLTRKRKLPSGGRKKEERAEKSDRILLHQCQNSGPHIFFKAPLLLCAF